MGHFGSKVFKVQELCDNRADYHGRGTPEQLATFLATFPPFMKQVAEGKEFTDEEILELPYYKYLETRLAKVDRVPDITRKGRRHAISQVRDAIRLFHDVKKYGLKAPLDMHYEKDGRLSLIRGGRRLVILNTLGVKTVPVRTFRSRDIFLKYSPTPKWKSGYAGESIWDLAQKQFAKLQEKATDKYWVHNYIPLYDRHISHLRDKKNLKILELGVSRGASLLLWRDAFPKAQIYGLDKNTAIWQPLLKGQDRIQVFVGRQENDEFIQTVVDNGPYDIIIDDCSHAAAMQQRMLHKFWNVCTDVYVIEDLRSGSYLKKLKRPKGVPRTTDILKKLVDNIHRRAEIRCMAHYYDICFLEKL